MRRTLVCAFTVLAVSALCQVAAADSHATMPSGADPSPSAETVQQGLALERMRSMPLAFTENRGQWDERVLFRANAGGATMWFTEDGVYYQFTRRIPKDVPSTDGPVHMPLEKLDHEPDSIEQLVVKASFVGANPDAEMVGEGLMEYKCNYFIGNDPDKWHTDVPNYFSVQYREVYPGIDLRFSGVGSGKAACEFIAEPGADMEQIKVEYEGIDELSVDASGRLVARTGWGDMIAAIGSPVDGSVSASRGLLLFSEKTAGFAVAGKQTRQSTSHAVTLDYSTFLGGGANDVGRSIAVDDSGAAYVAGYTESTAFPTVNPYQGTYQGSRDAFVTKLSSSGNSLVYSTYLGGSNIDRGQDIAIDGTGAAYITGYTSSSNFPTLNPYHTYQGGVQDAFVTKLSSSGSSLVYSTYLGGNDSDYGMGIALDGSGATCVTGRIHRFPDPWSVSDTSGRL